MPKESGARAASLNAAREAAYSVPLAELNPAQPQLFHDDVLWPYFERLRAEDPVHYTPAGAFAAHWSVTRYDDIVAVDTNHEVFSSASGTTLPLSEAMAAQLMAEAGPLDVENLFGGPTGPDSFISMDPPKHEAQRKTVSPAVSPVNLAVLAPLIRERAGGILDDLPIGEPFDWVDRVSKELTAMTLATLFGVPQADRRRLTRWSDVVMTLPGHGVTETWAERREELIAYASYFTALWNERVNAEPSSDLVSMLAHGAATRDMAHSQYIGNIVLLTVGGNDTTRNTITGSLYALNRYRDQYEKLKGNPSLIPSMVSETIRWQTPLAHMSRVATRDFVLGGKPIKAGDNVVMWYVSGNRDEAKIKQPDDFLIDRERPREHLSFGFGIHRCVGNRLAELQLTIIWEEIMKRFPDIQVLEEPRRSFSVFVKGYEAMQVLIPKRA